MEQPDTNDMTDEELAMELARLYTQERHRRGLSAGEIRYTSFQNNRDAWMKAAANFRDIEAKHPIAFIQAVFEAAGDQNKVYPNSFVGLHAKNAYDTFSLGTYRIRLKTGEYLVIPEDVYLFYVAYKTVIQTVAARHGGDIRITDDVVENTLMSPMNAVPPFYRCLFACNRPDMVRKYKKDLEGYMNNQTVKYAAETLGLGENYERVVKLWHAL